MHNKRYIELAQLLLERTKEQSILWIPSSNANTYQTKLGLGAVLIYFDLSAQDYYTGDQEPPLGYISFLNNRGEGIYVISVFSQEDSNFSLLENLYQLAKDSYLKTDETIQSMFDELNNPF